jgi:hypothetical protein
LKTRPAPGQTPNALCVRDWAVLQGPDDFPWRGVQFKDKNLYILDVGYNVMTTPHPTASPTVPLGMLQSITDAICDRPAESAADCASRRRVVMDMAQGFKPRDAVEMMLVGMVIAHAHLLEDAVHDVYHGQDDHIKARSKASIAGLDRGMFGFMRELRTVQNRRRKDEAVAGKAAGIGATADAGAAAKTSAPVAKPVIRDAASNEPAPAKVPSESLLPTLRSSETSVAAMMAVLSPAVPSFVMPAGLGRRDASLSPEIVGRQTDKAAADNLRARAA